MFFCCCLEYEVSWIKGKILIITKVLSLQYWYTRTNEYRRWWFKGTVSPYRQPAFLNLLPAEV